MRKIFYLFAFMFMTVMVMAGTGTAAAESSSSRVILYTNYRLIGEGDDIQIGSIDEEGVIRTLTGRFSESGWPHETAEQLEYLTHTEDFTVEGKLGFDELFAIKSLLYSVEDQGQDPVYAAEDAGIEESYAVRYDEEGKPVFILLGISGETVFENTDPNAQALYRLLRQTFPDIISYAYDPDGMGPAGFIPVPLSDLIGLDPESAAAAEIKGIYNDCETGSIPLEMTAEDKAELISLVRDGIVTGKADCLVSTGGTVSYSFFAPDGTLLGTAEFEGDLLVLNDGRYYAEVR